MNRVRIDEIQVLPARAKRLRLGESGVFHAALSAAPANDVPDLNVAPELPRSTRREQLKRALAALLRDGLDADGISRRDAGAVCDRQHQHVTDFCAGDGRAMTGADLVLLGATSESFWARVCDLRELLARRGK